MERSSEVLQRAARVAGLGSFEIPDLESVEQRRFQLWITALFLLVLIASAVIALTVLPITFLPPWLRPDIARAGLMVVVLAFCAYSVEKEIQLRRLTRLLVEERVLTAALTGRLEEVGALLEAGRALNLNLELNEVVATILRCAKDLLDGHDCSIQLLYGESELRTVNIAGDSAASGARIRVGQGVAGRVAETREPVLINGRLEHEGQRLAVALPPASAMSAPLVHRDSLLGVLNINAVPGRTYTEHDLRAFTLFGEQAAVAITNAHLYEAQRLSASRTSYQALHDGLTGLANRTLFVDRVEHALARRREKNERVALLFVDLDDFKRINDSLGHAAGDEVLRAFADRLRSSTRTADSVSRLGGDEFAVLVEEVESPELARQAAERILAALEAPISVGGREVRIGASIGIAMEEKGGPQTAQDLLRSADTALHASKEEGKSRVQVYEESMHTAVLRRLDLEGELERAIEGDQLAVHFQPIVDLSTRWIVAVEALVRWNHPTRGLVEAGSFVPLAEQAGLISRIDQWVLRTACRAIVDLDGAGPGLGLNVNVSPRRLQDSAFVDELGATLEETGLSPDRLVLEITENAILGDVPGTAARLGAIRRLGVGLALDDFGTGYSSLNHLRRFPVDKVKIDRSFVEELTTDTNGRNLVEAILRLGNGLRLDVIAEGVAKEGQRDLLSELGCRWGQGYLFGRAMEPVALAEMLKK